MKKKNINAINQIAKNFRDDNTYFVKKKDLIIAPSSIEDKVQGLSVLKIYNPNIIEDMKEFVGCHINGKDMYTFLKDNINKSNPEFEIKRKSKNDIQLKGYVSKLNLDFVNDINKRFKAFKYKNIIREDVIDITSDVVKFMEEKEIFIIDKNTSTKFKISKPVLKGYSKGDTVMVSVSDTPNPLLKLMDIIITKEIGIEIINSFIIIPMY